jgi:hypothetical protein
MIVVSAELPLPWVLTTTIASAHSGTDRSRFQLRGLTTGTRGLRFSRTQGGPAPDADRLRCGIRSERRLCEEVHRRLRRARWRGRT